MPKWLDVLTKLGPLVLSVTPLAPIAPLVIKGIALAESLPGATGPQKKAIVEAIVEVGADAANVAAGSVVVSPETAKATAGAVIDSVVGAVNLAHGP